MVQEDHNVMLDDVLDSPLILLTKLQAAMQSHSVPSYFHDSQQPSADLQYDVVPLCIQQALYCHPLGHTQFAFSSSVSSPSTSKILKEAEPINDCHLLGNPDFTSPYNQSCEQQQEGQQESMLLSSNLSACLSSQRILEPGYNMYHDDLNSSYLHSHHASHCTAACDLSTSPHDILLEHVQYDTCPNLASYPNVTSLQGHLQNEEYSSLIARDWQSSTNANSCNYMMNGNGILYSPHMAAIATSSSSSSSTPSNLAASGQLTDKQASWALLKTAWMGYGAASSWNCKQSDISCSTGQGMAVDVGVKYELGRDGVSAISSNISEGDEQKLKLKKRRKRKRKCSYKNVEEMETQRMTHITVERNRRKQMNDHLRALRLLMPQAYIQRGDQASIVGATIRFVAEMEQDLQYLKLQKHLKTHHFEGCGPYIGKMHEEMEARAEDTYASMTPTVANVEVTILTTNTFLVSIKAQKEPHQLLHTLLALSKLPFRMTHLTVTTIGLAKIYSFNLEEQEEQESVLEEPRLFQDAKDYVQDCDVCQRLGQPSQFSRMPLQPVLPLESFQKWQLDFIGPFKRATATTGNRYILSAIDYATKWVEAWSLEDNTVVSVAQCLYKDVFSRYGCPIELVNDWRGHFFSKVMEKMLQFYFVLHRKSSPYYPQANG
ncbi:hypothetical protein L7F22_032611 [Adiantum nelumboides]|nr:hypothetical protein [Adiantum nelumboides]